ncbi:MAG: ABC transporter permease [Puniceicoccaceae bacterium]|nr:MAG: ABC transporter permease [Puniceicoccaceae bacterium]
MTAPASAARPPSPILTVFRKECLETFRDLRVLLSVVVSPLLLTPLILLIAAFFGGRKATEQQTQILEIALLGGGTPAALAEFLQTDDTLVFLDFADAEAAEEAIRERRLRAALVFADDDAERFAAGERIRPELLFDASNERSTTAHRRLLALLERFNQDELERRLAEAELPPEWTESVRSRTRNLATEAALGGFILGIILPYLVIMGAAFGGMTSAFDLCAGEKERGTLETLLVSPASRQDIILGKLLTIGLVSLISAFCSVAGLILALEVGLQFLATELQGMIAVSYPALVAVLFLVLPFALMTSALLLLISAVARNQKEAQAYVFPLIAVILLPAMLSFILDAETSSALALAPILNTALAMKQVMAGATDVLFVSLTLFASLAYAAVAMALVVVLFQKERILFRV